jgi:hypothetical protein
VIARTPRSSRFANDPGSATSGRSLGGLFMALSLAFLGLFAAADAAAAGEKDADANKLYDAAMNDDYLNVELPKAEKKLLEAIKKCGSDGCSSKVLAKVYVGLGVIHFANNKPDLAKEAFANGLKADSSITLDATFKGAEIDKIFDDAKKSGGGSGGSSGSGGKGGGDSGEGGKKPGGDLKHTPPAEQQVNTPLPIYLVIPDDLGVKKVTLRYKPFGATNWKPLEMGKVGEGWGIEVPCIEVTTTGDFKYYITADDDAGTVATAGSRSEPYKVAIKNEIEGDSPTLPGKKAPKQCASTDCVPGFPRCVGADCSSAADCNEGLTCSAEGKCAKRSSECKPWGASCSGSSDCCEGLGCVEGSCQEGVGTDTPPPEKGKNRLNMFSLDGSLDLLLISGRERVCSGTTDGQAPKADRSNLSDGAYVCFESGTSKQFYGLPNDDGGTNGIQGGFGVAGGRVGIGFERQLTQKLNLTLGVRIGFALSGFPTSESEPNKAQRALGQSQANGFLPFFAEGRVGYNLFGGWVEKMKFKPYAYVGFGYGQVNAGVAVTVCDTKDENGDDLPATTKKGCPSSGSAQKNVDAYQITGLDYIPIGLGSTFGITDGFGLKLELRVMIMFPTSGVVFEPTFGPVYAF